MAYIFKCSNCEALMVTQFLKIGEQAKCKRCGAFVVVPQNCIEVDDEQTSPQTVSIPRQTEADQTNASLHKTSHEFKFLLSYGKFFMALGWLGIIGGIIAFGVIMVKVSDLGENTLFAGLIAGAPFVIAGLLLIAFGQMIICFVSIERNTRATNDILRSEKYL